jgi:hypothetical protein
MHRRELSQALLASATGAALLAPRVEAQTCTAPCYARTQVEIALGVTPANTAYPADPYVDPRRYGADPTGVADSTAAVQTAINVAYKASGLLWIGNQCTFKCGALSKTFTGNLTTNALRIVGSSRVGSRLTLNGTPTALLSFLGSTPTGSPQESLLVIEDLTLEGPLGSATDALFFDGVSNIVVRNVVVAGFSKAANLKSALDVYFDTCQFSLNTYGIFARTDGTGSPCNRVVASNCTFAACGSNGPGAGFAIDYDGGSHLAVINCDIEGCGITGNFSTGGVHVGANINNTLGVAVIWLDGNWLEVNSGWAIKIDSPASGDSHVSIQNNFTLNDDQTGGVGHAILISGGAKVDIRNCASMTPVAGRWDITCYELTLQNVSLSVLADANVTYPTYINVTTGAGHQHSGRVDAAVAVTMTGLLGSPVPGTIDIIQQGDRITLRFAFIAGTSNSTACTILTLPTKYRPSVARVILVAVTNNGVDEVHGAVVNTNGIIDLGAFQSIGTKAIRACEGMYTL